MTRIEENSGSDDSDNIPQTKIVYDLDVTELGYKLSKIKKLIINVDKPDRNEDSSQHDFASGDNDDANFPLSDGDGEEPPELTEEQYNPFIDSWEADEYDNTCTLNIQHSVLPLANLMSYIAPLCPQLLGLNIHANVRISLESVLNLESESSGVTSEEKAVENPHGITIFLRCRQPELPFIAVMNIISNIFPNVSDLTLDGDEQTELDMLERDTHWLADSLAFFPTFLNLRLEQFKGFLCLLTLFKFVVGHLTHLRFLDISKCNVKAEIDYSDRDFSESKSELSHLRITPVHTIPFVTFVDLDDLVFNVFKNLTEFIAENVACEAQTLSRLTWQRIKSGSMSTEELCLKQSLPNTSFNDLLAIVERFPRILKLQIDDCGTLEKREILEMVSACARLQHFSSFTGGQSLVKLAISDPFDRLPMSKMSSKLFDTRGGELQLEDYDFTLSVPEGAIGEHQHLEIGLQALTNPPSAHFEEDEMVASMGFRCTTNGTEDFRFARPVKVTIPHCAILDDPSNEPDSGSVQLGIYSGEFWHDMGEREISTIRYIPPSKDTCPRCECDQEKITVFVDHFSFQWPCFKIPNRFLKGKRLECLSFAPRLMPPTGKPILRVHLFDKIKGNPEEITQEELDCDFRKLLPKRELRPVKANLDVTLVMDRGNDNENEKTVFYDDIRKLVQNTVDFTMDFCASEKPYALVHLKLAKEGKDDAAKQTGLNIPINVSFDAGNAAWYRSKDDRVLEGHEGGFRHHEDEFDKILEELARELYTDERIERVAVKLGFRIADTKRYFEENKMQGVTSRGTLNMLRTWRRSVTKSREHAELRKALLAANEIRLASHLFGEEG